MVVVHVSLASSLKNEICDDDVKLMHFIKAENWVSFDQRQALTDGMMDWRQREADDE